jgi:hypothetical protein
MSWPVAALDPIRRLRVMAATVRGAVLVERTLAAPFADVWAVATGFEEFLHRFESLVRSAQVTAREQTGAEERLELYVRSLPGMPLRMDVTLRPGWCWMQAQRRSYVVGMAAEPDGEATRFAHLEGVPLPGGRLVAPIVRRLMAKDLDHIERLARERAARR